MCKMFFVYFIELKIKNVFLIISYFKLYRIKWKEFQTHQRGDVARENPS